MVLWQNRGRRCSDGRTSWDLPMWVDAWKRDSWSNSSTCPTLPLGAGRLLRIIGIIRWVVVRGGMLSFPP